MRATLVLVRHGAAGSRSTWVGDDRLRPLDERGREQAARLPHRLDDIPIRRIVSSPYLRCVQTVEPLARALGLEVEAAPELSEERQGLDGQAFLTGLLGEDAVVCVHGGIQRALGLDTRFRKADLWLFHDGLDHPETLA